MKEFDKGALNVEKNIYLAGVGGQGLQVAGKAIVAAAEEIGKNSTYSPKYGYEKRGGLTSCYLVISDDVIGNPRKATQDIIVTMEPKAYQKFKGDVCEGGMLLVNTSLIKNPEEAPEYIKEVGIPFHDICMKLGNLKVISAVVLGTMAYVLSDVFGNPDILKRQMLKTLKNKPELLALNERAFNAGYEAAKTIIL